MDAWIVALGSLCCLYTAWELAGLASGTGRSRAQAHSASRGAWEAPRGPGAGGQAPGQARAADSRSGRPLRLRVDRRSPGGRRTTDARGTAGEGTWSGAF